MRAASSVGKWPLVFTAFLSCRLSASIALVVYVGNETAFDGSTDGGGNELIGGLLKIRPRDPAGSGGPPPGAGSSRLPGSQESRGPT